jgi:hypothetical protein
MTNTDMTSDELHAWCETHPDYEVYKIKRDAIWKIQADKEGLTIEEWLRVKHNEFFNLVIGTS